MLPLRATLCGFASTRASFKPVFHVESRYITEMADVAGHEYPAARERGGGYL